MAPLVPILGAGLGAIMAPAAATALGITGSVAIGALTAGMAMAGQTLFGAVTGKKPGLDTLLTGATAGTLGGISAAGSGYKLLGEGAGNLATSGTGITGEFGKGTVSTLESLSPVSSEISQLPTAGINASRQLAQAMGGSAATGGNLSATSGIGTSLASGASSTPSLTYNVAKTPSSVTTPAASTATAPSSWDFMKEYFKKPTWKDTLKDVAIKTGVGGGLQMTGAYLMRPEEKESPKFNLQELQKRMAQRRAARLGRKI